MMPQCKTKIYYTIQPWIDAVVKDEMHGNPPSWDKMSDEYTESRSQFRRKTYAALS